MDSVVAVLIVFLIIIIFLGIGVVVYFTLTPVEPKPEPNGTLPSSALESPTSGSPVSEPTPLLPVSGSLAPTPKPVVGAVLPTLPLSAFIRTPVVLPDITTVIYGEVIKIKNIDPVYGGYMSPCGTLSAGGSCGIDVTIRPDNEFTKHEPNSNLRNWKISGGTMGQPVKYGDIIQIKGLATRWAGHDLYLSPCGASTSAECGVNVSLRPDSEFTKYEPGSNLRNWKIMGGPIGAPVRFGETVLIQALASQYAGHDLPLSLCGGKSNCGIDVTLRINKTLGSWVFEKSSEEKFSVENLINWW